MSSDRLKVSTVKIKDHHLFNEVWTKRRYHAKNRKLNVKDELWYDLLLPNKMVLSKMKDNEGNNFLNWAFDLWCSNLSDALYLEIINEFPDAIRIKDEGGLYQFCLYPNGEGLYPLHYSLFQKKSEEIVMKMIELFPKAVSIIGLRGCYPLHQAFDNKCSDTVVLKLIEVFPKAVGIPWHKSYFSLHDAFQCHYKHRYSEEVILKLIDLYPNAVTFPYSYDQSYILHSVIDINYSETIILKLIELYPQALSGKCYNYSSNCYPLRLAIKNKLSESILIKMIELFPMACMDFTLTEIRAMPKTIQNICFQYGQMPQEELDELFATSNKRLKQMILPDI